MTGYALDMHLTKQAKPGGLDDLFAVWKAQEIEISLPSMGGIADSISLGNKLRGALGAVLLKSASAPVSARKVCEWPYTCTMEMLYGKRPLVRLGAYDSEIPKPFVFSCYGDAHGALIIRMRLFGVACARIYAVADALIAAIRHEVRWHDLAKDKNAFVPKSIDPTRVRIKDAKFVVEGNGAPPASLQLLFRTEIDGERADVEAHPRFVLQRLIRRIALFAPWHGVDLRSAYPRLETALDKIEIDASDVSTITPATRGGHHFINRLSAPLCLSLSGNIAPIWSGVLMGQQTHVGRGASLGLGRYEIMQGVEL